MLAIRSMSSAAKCSVEAPGFRFFQMDCALRIETMIFLVFLTHPIPGEAKPYIVGAGLAPALLYARMNCFHVYPCPALFIHREEATTINPATNLFIPIVSRPVYPCPRPVSPLPPALFLPLPQPWPPTPILAGTANPLYDALTASTPDSVPTNTRPLYSVGVAKCDV